MPLESPPPLNIPKSRARTIKEMLESGENQSYASPLKEVDPMSLDELLNRIDSGALALGQVPDPKDIAELVSHYRAMCETFNQELQDGTLVKPKRLKSKPEKTQIHLEKGKSILSLL